MQEQFYDQIQQSEDTLDAMLRAQPTYLLENWRQILVKDGDFKSDLYVLDGVLNITDQYILIRTTCPGVANGNYSLAQPVKFLSHRTASIFESIPERKPDFDFMRLMKPRLMSKETVLLFLRYCTDMDLGYSNLLEFQHDKVLPRYPSSTTDTPFTFDFGFPYHITIETKRLISALKEASRYEQGVFFSLDIREPNLKSALRPERIRSDVTSNGKAFSTDTLFIGHNWERCILVAGINTKYTGGGGQGAEL